MNRAYRLIFFIILFMGNSSCVVGQQNTVASGGLHTGTGGSVSFTLGQIDYINLSSPTALITQGVQQPFELFIIATDIPIVIDRSPEFTLYPNPTKDYTVLHVKYSLIKSMSYVLYDILGRVVARQRLINVRTTIRMDNMPSAVYILTVIDDSNNKVITQFKIVKIL